MVVATYLQWAILIAGLMGAASTPGMIALYRLAYASIATDHYGSALATIGQIVGALGQAGIPAEQLLKSAAAIAVVQLPAATLAGIGGPAALPHLVAAVHSKQSAPAASPAAL